MNEFMIRVCEYCFQSIFCYIDDETVVFEPTKIFNGVAVIGRGLYRIDQRDSVIINTSFKILHAWQ